MTEKEIKSMSRAHRQLICRACSVAVTAVGTGAVAGVITAGSPVVIAAGVVMGATAAFLGQQAAIANLEAEAGPYYADNPIPHYGDCPHRGSDD